MHLSINLAKAIVIALALLMASLTMVLPVEGQGQYGFWTAPPYPTNVQDDGSVLLPAGVKPDFTISPPRLKAYLSFRPSPVGVGQTVLVNMWLCPPFSVIRYARGYKVTMTKPDGTTEVKTLDSYPADATAWFEFSPDQVGTWKLKFEEPGLYWPAGNYTIPPPVSRAGYTESYTKSVYYEPTSTAEQTLIVQQDMVASWPPAALPTDYWTRPVSLMNREWWPIAGNYPATGYIGGGDIWDKLYPKTDPYWGPDRGFTPWVQAPNTAHVVWKRLNAIGGLIGGQAYQYGVTGNPGTPSIIYSGLCYQTVTKPMLTLLNGTYRTLPTNVWQCYDLRTGEVQWELTDVNAPSYIEYTDPTGIGEVPGAEAAQSWSASLIAISGNRLIKYNPTTGAVTMNVSIPSFTTTTYYMNQYALSVQTISTTGNENKSQHSGGTGSAGSATAGIYRLINWTTRGTSSNFASRIISNISWPRNSLGTMTDFTTGLAFESREENFFDLANMGYPYVDIYYDNATGIRYGNRIKAYDLRTGKEMWDRTDYETQYSSSRAVADRGKIAIAMKEGYTMCWDQYTGKLLWKSELLEYPWDYPGFGAYSQCSAYGLIFNFGYSSVTAIDWETGKIAWTYHAYTNPYETPYTDANGTTVTSFNSGGTIADGKLYIANSEHTPSWPLTRGWRLHCINVTTGEGIWSIASPMSAGAIADGYLTASNSWDGYMYVFGKGKSKTTVDAPSTALPKGQGIVIRGTVLDMSPAQPDTPCISKESMTTQMEYLHLQQPIDGLYRNVTMTGVPVTLTALDANDNAIDIGTATTSAYYGTFEMAWTPPSEGTYKIIASFAGDDSYGSSGASTAISVGPATSEITIPEQIAPPDYTMAIIGGIIAVIIAVAISTVLLYRKK